MSKKTSKTVGELTLNDLHALNEEIKARSRQFEYDVNKSRISYWNATELTAFIYLNDKYNEKPNRYNEPEVPGCCANTSKRFDLTESVDNLNAWMQEQFADLKTPAERERIHLAAKMSGEAGLAQHYSPELRKLWMAAWERAMKDSGLLALVDGRDAA